MRIIRHCRMERDGMEKIMSIYSVISCITCFIVAIMAMDNEVFDEDSILSDKIEFIRCVFMFQVFAYESLKGTINKAGIAIVEILLTFFVYPWSILFFVLLIFAKVIIFIFHIFWLIFRIRKDDDNA